ARPRAVVQCWAETLKPFAGGWCMNPRAVRSCFLGAFAVALAMCGPDDVLAPVPPPAPSSTPPLPSPLVVISEIMYHPVDEDTAVDNHEFIEIYNRASSEVDLGGWRIAGGPSYTFPAGTRIPARGYRVIAKNRAALAAITSYDLREAELLGDY